MDVVVVQPSQAETKVGKENRIFWLTLDLIAVLFWAYAIVKVFVFDVDVYLISLVSPEFVWLLNYRLLILLGVIVVAMLVTGSFILGFAFVYVALYPFVVLFWKFPRFVWKQQSWLSHFFCAAISMAEAELCKIKGTNKALDRPHRIVWSDIVLNPSRKKTRLFPALAGLECMIRHKPNRTSTPENADILAQPRQANHF